MTTEPGSVGELLGLLEEWLVYWGEQDHMPAKMPEALHVRTAVALQVHGLSPTTRPVHPTCPHCGRPPIGITCCEAAEHQAHGETVTAGHRSRVGRILWNERDKDIDEVVLSEARTVHVEQMSDRCWWIGVYLDDDRYWMGNFVADSRGRMRFVEQENAGVEWDDDRDHEAVT